MRRRELLAAAAVLGVVALVVLGPYALDGGFLMDDWTNAAIAQFASSPFDAVADYRDPTKPSANHVGLPVAFAVQFGVLGEHYSAHLLAVLASSVLMVTAFFAVLRTLRVPALHAGVLAAFVLLFPFADSTRLWATLAPNNIAVALWLAGVLAALRGVRERSWGWHGLALGLYAVSILLYELTAAAVALSAVLYLFFAPPRAVLWRWVADVATSAACLAIFVWLTPRRPVTSVGDQLDHLWEIVSQVPDVLALALWPFGGLPSGIAVLVVAAVAALGIARRRRRGLIALGLGVIGLVAGYALLVPAEDWYVPLYPHQGNRVNLVASFGFAGVLYGIALIVAAERRAVGYAVGAAAVVLAVGYAVETRQDADRWSRAFALEERTLATLGRTVPKPPPGVTVYVYGQPGRIANGIPVFDWRFDLTGAVKLLWDDPTVNGYPILTGTDLVCEADGMHPDGTNGLDINHGSRYGAALLVDVSAGRRVGVDSREECERERARFEPAPLYVD